jgi:glutaminyl-tRNA synthetase
MSESEAPLDFIRQIISDDLASGKHASIVTRFPPEPNGYLHIGHAKAICLNFGVAQEFGGQCNLRFDDTNPAKEEEEYIRAIEADVRWLGFDWGDNLHHASDYFEQLFDWAVHLIENGDAFIDDQAPDLIREQRGNLNTPGTNSPCRERPAAESLDLFQRMRAGEFDDGAMVLRAKIDMASPNMNLRDPVIYRISRQTHPRTGDAWCIYPMYDFAHGQSDALECITHSLCTLEFENHRPLYDWLVEHLPTPSTPRQIEFSRLNLTYTVTSKRKLLRLVEEGLVSGWDDPRMPTLSGLRRRGFPPEAIVELCKKVGVTKYEGTTDVALLESTVRDHLNAEAPRRLAVLRPLKVVITNYQGSGEMVEAPNHPGNADMGTRELPFGGVVYIERSDFMQDPPKKYFRLAPGKEVRLRYAYNIVCEEVIRDESGEVIELRCTYDPDSKGGGGRKVKGIIHWVSAADALDAEVRLYDHLFNLPNPEEGGDYIANLNPDSLQVLQAKVEPSLAELTASDRVQFERSGFFCLDYASTPGFPVFNRVVALRDGWAKIQAKQKASKLS